MPTSIADVFVLVLYHCFYLLWLSVVFLFLVIKPWPSFNGLPTCQAPNCEHILTALGLAFAFVIGRRTLRNELPTCSAPRIFSFSFFSFLVSKLSFCSCSIQPLSPMWLAYNLYPECAVLLLFLVCTALYDLSCLCADV